jgi:hypothetical protein
VQGERFAAHMAREAVSGEPERLAVLAANSLHPI